MRSCGGAAGRVTILAERHGTPGPLLPVDPFQNAAMQLPRTGLWCLAQRNRPNCVFDAEQN